MIGQGRSVLVIDDVPEMRSVLCNMLKRMGFAEIVEAPSGADAKRLIAARSFDIMVLDRRISDGDGLSIVDWMHHWTHEDSPAGQIERGKLPAVIMVSSYSDRCAVTAAGELKVSAILAKPVTRAQLEAEVTACLSKAV